MWGGAAAVTRCNDDRDRRARDKRDQKAKAPQRTEATRHSTAPPSPTRRNTSEITTRLSACQHGTAFVPTSTIRHFCVAFCKLLFLFRTGDYKIIPQHINVSTGRLPKAVPCCYADTLCRRRVSWCGFLTRCFCSRDTVEAVAIERDRDRSWFAVLHYIAAAVPPSAPTAKGCLPASTGGGFRGVTGCAAPARSRQQHQLFT